MDERDTDEIYCIFKIKCCSLWSETETIKVLATITEAFGTYLITLLWRTEVLISYSSFIIIQ